MIPLTGGKKVHTHFSLFRNRLPVENFYARFPLNNHKNFNMKNRIFNDDS